VEEGGGGGGEGHEEEGFSSLVGWVVKTPLETGLGALTLLSGPAWL
jgi:hypothetical protein